MTGQKEALITAVLLDVAELPDRTSPDDWPEAMLVTGEELDLILRRHLADALEPLLDAGIVHEPSLRDVTEAELEALAYNPLPWSAALLVAAQHLISVNDESVEAVQQGENPVPLGERFSDTLPDVRAAIALALEAGGAHFQGGAQAEQIIRLDLIAETLHLARADLLPLTQQGEDRIWCPTARVVGLLGPIIEMLQRAAMQNSRKDGSSPKTPTPIQEGE